MASDLGGAALWAVNVDDEPTMTPKGKSKGKGKGNEPPAKRVCLRHYDLPPMQMLNPMGVSGIESVSTEKYWELLCAGNKSATHFSNLCFEDPARKNVGISQLAEVLTRAIERLKSCKYLNAIVKTTLMKAAITEGEALLPHLRLLNQGAQGRAASTGSIRQAAYASCTAITSVEDAQALDTASKALLDWLQNDDGALRGLFAMLSAGGVFYVAQTHEKAARAAIAHGDNTEEAWANAMKTRASTGLLSYGDADIDFGKKWEDQ